MGVRGGEDAMVQGGGGPGLGCRDEVGGGLFGCAGYGDVTALQSAVDHGATGRNECMKRARWHTEYCAILFYN